MIVWLNGHISSFFGSKEEGGFLSDQKKLVNSMRKKQVPFNLYVQQLLHLSPEEGHPVKSDVMMVNWVAIKCILLKYSDHRDGHKYKTSARA